MEKIIINGREYQDIKIGSDPELRFQGLKAREFVPHLGKFGADGPNSYVGELRPDAKYCPINHVAEIERILRDGYRKYPKISNVKWLGGGCPDDHPIGGHIHFGTTYKEHLELKLVALDCLLAPIALLLESKYEARHRRKELHGGYGKLATHNCSLNGDYRGFKTQEHYGGSTHPLSHPGLEYRPLASWLVSKNVASGILSLAKVIGFETHNKELHRKLWYQLRFIKLNKKFYESYLECDKQYFLQMVPTIYRIISTFKLFSRYEKYINYIFHLIAQNRTWESDIDLKTRWNMIPAVKKSEKKKVANIITAEKAWDALSTNNFDNILSLSKPKALEFAAIDF